MTTLRDTMERGGLAAERLTKHEGARWYRVPVYWRMAYAWPRMNHAMAKVLTDSHEIRWTADGDAVSGILIMTCKGPVEAANYLKSILTPALSADIVAFGPKGGKVSRHVHMF